MKNAADMLSQSVPNNITSEMGLALLDVADVIRPYREVTNSLHNVIMINFCDGLIQLKGGQETQDAYSAFLFIYTMATSPKLAD
ncbi:hypothetical protein PAV_9c00030 [Paenibacillus alvei DSM 29]|nr:hypothetical protein PAV_9c00030 [Paenibacillus alvei DSM 29]